MNKNKKINLLFNNLLVFALFLTCIIVPTANNSLSIKAVTTSSICSDPTASDYATKCTNEIELSTKMENVIAPAGTNYQQVWTRELSEFKWTDTSAMTTDVDLWDGTNDEIPTKSADEYYIIDTAEKLAYVISNLADNDKIRLIKNIDLKGYKHKWNIGHGQKDSNPSIGYNELIDGVEIDGGGFTIYNLGTIDNWFIRGLKNADIKNLNFVSSKMYYSSLKPNTFMGIFGAIASKAGIDSSFQLDWINSNAVADALNAENATYINNISVANSVFHSKGAKQQGSSAYISPLGHQIGVHAKLIRTTDNSLYGEGAHVGGAFGRPDAVEISNSYSLDSTIIANANHSGGFISCTNGGLSVKNSFTNNEVYAKESTGVFIGAVYTDSTSPNTMFENCYTSGTLEGTQDLGGFIGLVEGPSDAVVTFKNCYSTSIVGMENGGTRLGGFLGSAASSKGGGNTKYTFTNCYAAGEVGHISTNVDIKDTSHANNNTVGGFAGQIGTATGRWSVAIDNVYYDKQTTGMREWQTGNSMDSAKNLLNPLDSFEGYQNNGFKANIRGVLTSDSEKSGKGLASLPDGTKDRISGFVGFTNDDDWVYDGGNTDSSKHNCLYPQLAVFEKPDKTLWGSAETVNLVAASSLASVSTVHENVWEKGEKDQQLSTTVYDTVRELTTRFTMTSYVTSSLTDRNIEINWQKTNAKVDLYGESINVIGSLTNSYNAKYQRPYLTADKFAPGIEWMTVTVDVGGQKGTRKIRIIPTMNIDPGKDNLALNDGNNYNHAKDVKFAFSTGLRMSTNADDITRALYPDKLDNNNKFNDDRDDFVDIYSKDNKLSSMNSFNNQDDKYIVNSKYITENNTASDLVYSDTETDYIHVRMFKVDNVTPINDQNSSQLGSSGKLDIDRRDNLLNNPNSPWIDKLNGTSKLGIADEGKYVVEYSCTLPDGRYLRDSKLLVVRKKNYDVSMQVLNYKDGTYDTENGTLNNNVFSLKADKYTNDADILQDDYGTKTAQFKIPNGVEKATPVYMAGKKLNADYDVKAIKLEVESFGGTQSQVFDSIKVSENTELEFLYDYYYGSYEVNGEYFVRIMQIPKKYSVVYNADNQIYYTVMNFKSNDSQYQDLIEAGVNIEDIDVDVKASIFVINNNPTTGSLKIIKETIHKDGQSLTTDEKFPFKISQSNTFQLGLLLSSATNNNTNIYTVSLPAGTYAFDEVVPMRYELFGFEVTNPDNKVNTDKKEFVIEGGKETTVKLTNKKMYDNGGTHYVTNTLKTAK